MGLRKPLIKAAGISRDLVLSHDHMDKASKDAAFSVPYFDMAGCDGYVQASAKSRWPFSLITVFEPRLPDFKIWQLFFT